jgi:hypothetical protein
MENNTAAGPHLPGEPFWHGPGGNIVVKAELYNKLKNKVLMFPDDEVSHHLGKVQKLIGATTFTYHAFNA